ncbi:MAG: ABC transporter substrate-binding protein [bacterium]|nr:ABC transporter substrate-binding protein [bacterium]
MTHRIRVAGLSFFLGICFALAAYPALAQDVWERVKQILINTNDIIVLNGAQTAPLKYTEAKDPVYGDWLVQHFLSDPENFNPYTSNDAGASSVHLYVFESLLDIKNDPPYEMIGLIAKTYPAISEDKLTYTFDLRENVQFADGKPLTADDVLFSMKVIKNPAVLAASLRNYFAAVKDVRQEGTHKISFVCDEPYFRNDISLGTLQVIPRHFYDPDGLLDPVSIQSLVDGSWESGPHAERVQQFGEKFNTGFNRSMLGSGPYKVADWESDVVTGQKVVLTRNQKYWGQNQKDLMPKGYVSKIVFKIINNTDAAFIELTNGNLDRYSLQPLEFKDKSWSPEFTGRFLKGISYSSGYVYIGWNNAHPIFRDKRVRHAMTHMTNRKSMVQNLMFGLAETVEGPIHKFRPEYNHDLEPYEYDPEKALDLLEEAGWADTDGDGILDKIIDGEKTQFQFEFLVNSGNQMRKDIALALQYELQDVGIVCEVRELDWTIFLDRVARKKEFAACTLGWTGSLRLAPDSYQIWHSSQAEGQGSNFISFRNAEVDSILEAYRKEFDPDKRIAMYKRFQEILHEEQPYTFLWKSRNATAYSRRFENVNWYPGGIDTQEWFVTAANRLYQ